MNPSPFPQLETVLHPTIKVITKIDPRVDCLFLDFDGTLVEFAEHPDDVIVPARVREEVARLLDVFDGALAIVSGRRIEDIDYFLVPLLLPVAGVHGMTRRDGAGRLHEASFDKPSLNRLASQLKGFVDGHAGLLIERKYGSLALHYRKRPDLEMVCSNAMRTALENIGPAGKLYHVMNGKMVIEARASGKNKSGAIVEFMAEAPFSGRRPIFAGDDVTDEAGFEEINARGGLSIKVGDGETKATYRACDIASFRDWLHMIGR